MKPSIIEESLIESIQESDVSKLADLPAWMQDLREKGIEYYQKQGLPSTHDEDWRYTNLQPLSQIKFRLSESTHVKSEHRIDPYRIPGALELVMVNGHFVADYSRLNQLPKELTVTTLDSISKGNSESIQSLLSQKEPCNSLQALNWAFLQQGIFIHLQKPLTQEVLVHLIYLNGQERESIVSFPRNIILLEQHTQLTVVESHIGIGESECLNNGFTEIALRAGAQLTYCKIQQENLQSYHVHQARVQLERDSRVHTFSFSVGGKLTRNNLNITFQGESAEAVLNGFYYARQNQLIDNHTLVEHLHPNCHSNQLYKGILRDRGRGVFNGKIYVHPRAQKTDAYQLNKTLLLSSESQIDTKPQLEIFADDVKCTHGATIGQIDPDELFYLESRAIPKHQAINMLSRGFANHVILQVKQMKIQTYLNALLDHVLFRS